MTRRKSVTREIVRDKATGRLRAPGFLDRLTGQVETVKVPVRTAKDESYRLKVVVGHTGRIIGTIDGPSIAGLMAKADAQWPDGDAIIRGEFTSDGTNQGPGLGRVYATREGKRWLRY